MLTCEQEVSGFLPSNLVGSFSESEGVGGGVKGDKKGLSTTLFEKLEFVSGQVNSFLNSNPVVAKEIDSEEDKRPEKKLRTGRWTKLECKLFEEALKKFGKSWKKVEAYVGTRNGTQIRSHAQKYFLKPKGETLSVHHDFSVAPNTSIGATNERPETDMKQEEDKILNSKLVPLQEVVSQSTFTITTKDTIQNTNIKRPVFIPCKYLMEHMSKYGFNDIKEIYAKFSKLGDWVENISITKSKRSKNFRL